MASSNAGIVHHPKDGRDIFVQTAKHEQTSIEKVRKAIIVLVGFALTAVSSSCKDSSKHDGAVRQASTTLRKARVTQVILAGQIRIDFGDASGQSWPLQSRLSAKRFLKDLPRLIARYVHISTSAMGVILTDAIIASIELLHVRLDRQYQKLAKTMGRCAALKMALRKTKGYCKEMHHDRVLTHGPISMPMHMVSQLSALISFCRQSKLYWIPALQMLKQQHSA
eukprot:TRINITY_DN8576_c0_g1_i2.p1 TRINITY_DN8576_c0_g1~~TRINITY_DN8576_c0_g1_i2.p1  ORF type:complete len:224 (+),score=14.20 TRINITY_DN8576_c0_g1_i2:74-745(+)